MARFKVEFQNISRGVRTVHGNDAGSPASGKPGEQGYQPPVAPQPIVRLNPKGITIHGIAPDAVGSAEMSADGVDHFERLGLIRVIAKQPMPDTVGGFIDVLAMQAEIAALKARLAERGIDMPPPAMTDNRKANAKS